MKNQRKQVNSDKKKSMNDATTGIGVLDKHLKGGTVPNECYVIALPNFNVEKLINDATTGVGILVTHEFLYGSSVNSDKKKLMDDAT